MDRQSFEQNKARRDTGMRTVYNYVMGVLWFAVGLFFLNHGRFGLEGAIDPLLARIFGVCCLFYGLFRVWRGYRSRANAE